MKNRHVFLRQYVSCAFLLCVMATAVFSQTFPRKDLRFSDNWRFYRGDVSGAEQVSYTVPSAWDTVCLPHTVRVESAKTHTNWDYYQGYCWYRKSFTPDTAFRGKKIFLEVEAGMQTTQVWVNGTSKITYGGGYSPFCIDITNNVVFNQANVIAMRLNNAADATVPPGAEQRDFYYYGGLYRYVNLHVVDSLHITDAVYANLPASGGVFITYPAVSATSATVRVKTHVINEGTTPKSCVLATTLIDSSGAELQTVSATKTLGAGANDTFVQTFTVANPRLWSPSAPNLYVVRSRLSDNTRPADEVKTTIGIRRLAFSAANGFQINGVRMKSKGMNRHQDYGALGNAVPVSGQYRDALRMKEAGVNFVRLSHYIQHPAFLDACDKLGITVQACMPGWQYNGFSNTTFVNNSVRDLRTLIRYYRNHPCVIMWEAVHNESNPPKSFSDLAQAAAHEEYPSDQMWTCGQENNYSLDMWQAAVQQGGRNYGSGETRPQAISEYGHWEWGGFTYGGTSSNQPRGIGEAGMLTLASNQATAMSQDHALSWLSVDALWVYNDYFGFTQYNSSLCGGGIVDPFRIPKFGYYFYQAQRDTAVFRVPGTTVSSGPMVRIANFYTSSSPLSVRVYSNCTQVRLTQNTTVIGTRSPDALANVEKPPFTFTLPSFASGVLIAEGLIGGVVRARDTVRTPGTAARIKVTIDTATLPFGADGSDIAVVYGSIVDASGTVLPTASNSVTFTVNGPGRIISGDGNPTAAVAGIAAVYLQSRYADAGLITITATSGSLTGSATVRSVPVSSDLYSAIRRPGIQTIPTRETSVEFRQQGSGLLVMTGSAGAMDGVFTLYNLQGRVVRAWSRSFDAKTLFDCSGCGRGIYFGKLAINGRSFRTKTFVVGK